MRLNAKNYLLKLIKNECCHDLKRRPGSVGVNVGII